jgi:hypothetical protein
MPGWVRGRMNSFQIVLGQGSMALGAAIWGTAAAYAGLDLTFVGASLVALAGLALGHRFSINFAIEASVDAAPLNYPHNFPVIPKHDDGPIRITIEYAIAGHNREQFRALMQEVQATIRRNARSSAGSTRAWISPACSAWITWSLRGLSIFAGTRG